jgi:hypothetical protein
LVKDGYIKKGDLESYSEEDWPIINFYFLLT